MIKKIITIISGFAIILFLLQSVTSHASVPQPVTPVTGGGTGTSTVLSNTFVWANASGTFTGTSTPSGGGSGSVTTSSAVTAKYFPYWANSTGGLNGTSSVYQASANDLTLASTSDNGLFSIVNASNTVVLQVASTTNNSNVLTVVGHMGFATSSVSVSSCGTGSPTITGSDDAFAVVTGSSASACTVTFATKWVNPPVCVISDSNTSAVIDISAISSSSVTMSIASALSAVNIYGICIGSPN